MQRSFAGILFLLAGITLSLAVGGWWLQRAVFDPQPTESHAAAMLDEQGIREEITTIVATASANALGQSPNDVATFVEPILASRPGAGLMTEILAAAHERVIGGSDEPVRITGEQLIQIVRDERAAEVPTVTLPVPEVGTLRVIDSILRWFAPIAAGIGLLLAILALATRPERREITRGLGELALALAASMLVFGYLVPVLLVPTIDDGTWTRTVPQLAKSTLPIVLVAALVLAAGGIGLVVSSAGSGRRKQWSTPLSVGRYRDDRSWS